MGEIYSYNNKYLLRDGKAWFPVMGEIHFSRYKAAWWEESLRKMKAGGVSIASVYVIWIHHEEIEGQFDFSGNRSLRRFLEVAKKVGISVFLRLGPWVHGEVRNGGFPDWLQAKHEELDLRSNDQGYLYYVRRFWEQVHGQVKGYLCRDGGPVIGVQIENEYGHVGGYRGEKGEQHMRTLAALARKIGFDVPFYTATGWGGAVTGGLLPVMGGYCEAPWDQRVTEIEPNSNYVFSHIRNDSLIASDHQVDDTLTFCQEDFPYLTAELGGGVQVTKHRRPIATGPDIGAMSLVKLGSGVALLGYYMYHGGSNPDGKLSTLQESRATGYYNDLPEINYDFNAPIRQFGTISDNYREIRLLAYFLQDFGTDMALLPAEITPELVKPQDCHTLRTSCRHDDKHGYVFVNNYQRRQQMDRHEGVVLEGKTHEGTVYFPKTDIEPGEYAFFPYNMPLGNALLVSALATPLCALHTAAGDVYVFYGDKDPQFKWDKEPARVLMLKRWQALKAARVCLDQEYLVLADDFVWEEDKKLRVAGGSKTTISVFPKLPKAPEGFKEAGPDGEFTVYIRNMPESEKCFAGKVSMELLQTKPGEFFKTFKNSCGQPENIPDDCRIYEIEIEYCEKADSIARQDCILTFDYACESMDIYEEESNAEESNAEESIAEESNAEESNAEESNAEKSNAEKSIAKENGGDIRECTGLRKLNDYFYTGQKAVLSLGYFDFPKKLVAVLHPLHESDHIYLQEWPRMYDGTACRIEKVQLTDICH